MSILPADEATLQSLTKELPGSSKHVGCLVAADGNERLGTVIYRVEEQTVCLLSLEAEEPPLGDALLRAALNRAESGGAKAAVCSEAALFPLLEKLGFVPGVEGTERRADIRAVLRCSCNGR